VRLIIVRHAEAASGEPDELRPLTPDGRADARALGKQLAAEQPGTVLCSPLLRARETAEPIAEAAGVQVELDERLAPGATVDDVREVVAGRPAPVVIVGHQPDCSEIVFALTGREERFRPGAFLAVEL
jgi:phosphohistidine phosphatase SixA